MQSRLNWVGAFAAALAVGGPVAAQTVEGGGVSVRLSGRIQYQYNTSSVEDVPGTFEARRVRQAVRLNIDDWIEGQVEADFANGRLALKSTYMNLAFSDAVNLQMGQFKMPFGLIQLTSSTQTLTIERGLRIRGLDDELVALDGPDGVLTEFAGNLLMGESQTLLDEQGYQGYDVGAQVHGSAGRLGYAVGLFNGNGADARDVNAGKTIAGRATFALGAADAPFVVGAAVSFHDVRDPVDADETTRGTAFEVDAEYGDFRRPGLHVQAEIATGENLAVDETFLGAQAVAGWFVPLEGPRVEGWEAVGRVSWGDPSTDRDGDAGTLLTPGFNVYFHGRNRLMANWDVFVPQGAAFETRRALRLQAQLYY